MLPLLGEIRAACDGYIAALPVPYRTTEAEPTFQSLTDPDCDLIPGGRPFPTALDRFLVNRYEIAAFTTAAAALGVNYFGICCGCAPHHVRAMAAYALYKQGDVATAKATFNDLLKNNSHAALKVVNIIDWIGEGIDDYREAITACTTSHGGYVNRMKQYFGLKGATKKKGKKK